MRKADDKFLSTSEDWDLLGLIRRLPTTEVPVCLVFVKPRYTRTGLSEECGCWIAEFWHRVLNECPDIYGHRLMWSSVIFFWPNKTSEELKDIICNLLRFFCSEELKSLALFSMVSGMEGIKLEEIERMELQLTKLGYWTEHLFPSYYEDGVEKSLKPGKLG